MGGASEGGLGCGEVEGGGGGGGAKSGGGGRGGGGGGGCIENGGSGGGFDDGGRGSSPLTCSTRQVPPKKIVMQGCTYNSEIGLVLPGMSNVAIVDFFALERRHRRRETI